MLRVPDPEMNPRYDSALPLGSESELVLHMIIERQPVMARRGTSPLVFPKSTLGTRF
jgi:hypothetical protein